MKKSLKLFLSVALAALPVLAAPPPIEAILPADGMMVVLIEDAPTFLGSWSGSPLGKAWNDDAVKRFFAPLRREMELDAWDERTREATGFSLEEIFGSFNGQIALVLDDMSFDVEDQEADPDISVAIVAAVGKEDVDTIRSLLRLDLEHEQERAEEGVQIREIDEEFQGEVLHIRQTLSEDKAEETEGWAIVNGYAVMAEPKGMLQRLVSSIKSGGTQSRLSESGPYTKLTNRSPDSDLLVYFNLERIVPQVLEAIEAEEAAAESEPNPMGITARAVFQAMGLDALQGAYVSARIGKAATSIDFGLLYKGDEGLVKLLAYQPGPVELPEFMPRDAISVGVANFSFPKMWLALREMAAAINPMFPGMLEMTLQQFEANAGFDLEQSLLDSLGDRFVSAEFLRNSDDPSEDPSLDRLQTLYGIAVTDRQTLEMALEGVKALTGQGMELFDQREYLGHTLFISKPAVRQEPADPGEETVTEPAPQSGFAYTLTDDYLLVSVGGTYPLEAALSGAGSPGRSIWKQATIKTAIGGLPKDAAAVYYYDVRSLIRSLFTSLVAVQGMGANGGQESGAEEDPFDCCDIEAVPDPEALSEYFGIAVGYLQKDSTGLFSRLRFLAP